MVYRVFVSHAFDHFALFDSVVSRLNSAHFNWLDCSVPKHRRYSADGKPLADEEMKALLSRHIDECDVVVVIAKPVASRRQWLRWELDYARAAGKPILAVWRRQVDLRVSKFARDRADRCVDTWNISSIIRAIEDLAARPRASDRPSSTALIQKLPVVGLDPENDDAVVPEIASAPAEPLAPVGELALVPGESIEGKTPREALAPTFERMADGDPLERAVIPSSQSHSVASEGGENSPKAVVAATQARRRWWQFWKSRDQLSVRPS